MDNLQERSWIARDTRQKISEQEIYCKQKLKKLTSEPEQLVASLQGLK